MERKNFPQVLLLGNGLNRTFAARDWGKLIEDIQVHPKYNIKCKDFESLPFPLQAVLATGDEVDKAIKDKKTAFLGLTDIEGIKPFLEELLGIGFDHILTTNYSYELERTANSKVKADGTYCKNLMRHTEKVVAAESKYLLHTYNSVSYAGRENKIWHIHGEARKPGSVILGHYYYGKLLSKIQNELEKLGNKQWHRQQNDESPYVQSWIDAFIMGDVYVLGYGMDLSEMDMWWLLNRKKREKAAHGNVYFYEYTSDATAMKKALLETYGVMIETLGYYSKPREYSGFYRAAIADIEEKFKNRKSNQ